ncbi:MAG: ATP-binding protein [Thermodesulfovibrionales bacterium]
MYIQRELERTIRKYLSTPEIIAVIGARQVGKTTLLRHIQEGIKKASFVTFEDLEVRALFDRDIKSFIELYVKPFRCTFIDEFQYAKNGGQSLKFIYDTVKDKKIFISGSSILDLTVTTVKHLVGRIFSFTLYPLTFQEYLSYRDRNLYQYYLKTVRSQKIDPVLQKNFSDLLKEFIVYGGYPRVVIAKDDNEKQEILKSIFNIYLLRDVRDILGLIDDYKMFNLVKALSLQVGNVISYEELSAFTQQRMLALKKHLNLLEKTYVIHLLRPFFTNKRTELVKNSKVYFYDTGLRNALINDFKNLDYRQDKGVLYENFIFSELIKNNLTLKYWRTKSKAEVDFIVNDKVPVEVKSLLSKPVIGKSLFSFIEKYHPEKAFVFNEKIFDSLVADKTLIQFLYLFSAFQTDRSLPGTSR